MANGFPPINTLPMVTGAEFSPVALQQPVVPPAAPVDEFAGFEPVNQDEFAQFQSADDFQDFTQADAVDLSTPEQLLADPQFNAVQYLKANPSAFDDPAKRAKILEAYRQQRIRGITSGVVKEALKATPQVGLEFLKGARDLTARMIDIGLQPAVNTVLGLFSDPQTRAQLQAETKRTQTKAIAEIAAGSEAASFGLANLLRTGARKAVTSDKELQAASEADLTAQLMDDVAFADQAEQVIKGQGAAAEKLGLDAAELAKEGIELDSSAIESISFVDPLTLVGTGGAFSLLAKGGRVIARTKTAAQAAQLASRLGTSIAGAAPAVAGALPKVAGAVASGVGRGIEKTGQVLRAPLKVAGGVAGMVKGAELGGLAGAGAGAAAGSVGGATVAKGIEAFGRGIQTVGKTTTAFGRQLAGQLPKGPFLKTLEVASRPFRPAVAGATVGAVAAAPLALMTDTDMEAAQLLAGGIALGGAAGAGVSAARGLSALRERVVGQRLMDPFDRSKPPVVRDSPDYGLNENLDAIHRAEFDVLDPESKAVVNEFRELFRGEGEIYLQNQEAYAQRVAEIMELEKGGPLTAEELAAAQDYAGTHAVFAQEFQTPQGPRKVVFLNKDVTGLKHDAGHLFEAVLPEAERTALRQEVTNRYTADELGAFKTLYEEALNQGRPAGEPRRTLSTEEVVGEIIAENFSALFSNVDVASLGTPRPMADRFIQTAAAFAEKAGVDLSGGRVTPNLEVRQSLSVQRMLENAARQRAQRPAVPAPEGPRVDFTPAPEPTVPRPDPVTPPASGPEPVTPPARPLETVVPTASQPDPTLRNIRVTPEEQAGTAAPAPDSANVSLARDFTRKANNPILTRAVEDVAAAFERKRGQVTPLELEVLGAKEAQPGKPTGRLARLEERVAADVAEAMGAMPEDVRSLFQKVTVPVRFETVAGKLQLVAMSLDKVVANVGIIAREAGKKGIEGLIPYDVVNGKLTDTAWRQLQKDLTAYTENQQNGFRGDGRKLTRPDDALGVSIPPENPNYRPTVLPENVGLFMNLLQGIAPPRTARVTGPGVPGNVKARTIAELNFREVQMPAKIAPKDAAKQTFPTGETVGEVNPLRNEFAREGVPIRDLHEVTERIRMDRVKTVKPRSELTFRAPFTDVVRAGFLPADLQRKRIVAAALRNQRGEIITGSSHPEAFMNGLDEGKIADTDIFEDGFVDGEGNFLMRDEALKRSIEIKQVEEAALPFAGRIGLLESGEFQRAAKFLPEERDKALRTGLLPDKKPAKNEPVEAVRNVASAYAREAGLDLQTPTGVSKMAPELGMEIADFFEAAQSQPEDPAVQASYQALADETRAQFRAMEQAGVKVEPFTGEGEPYKSSADMVADVRDNKHLYFLQTKEAGTLPADHPLAGDSGIQIDGQPVLMNDLFRAVHDYFGHAKDGYQFGPQGEFNAWRAHSEMFSPEAQGALASETLAQNAWVNFGPHLRKSDGTLTKRGEDGFVPPSQRPFATQKVQVVPDEIIGRAREAAKFLPETLTDATAQRFTSEIAEMSPEDFTAYAKTLPTGITGKAMELGRVSKTPEAVKSLQDFQEQASTASKKAMEAGDFDAAMTEATRSQFFREAMETAANTGSMGKAMAERGADFLAPPPVKFLPRTSRGAELAQARGYEFVDEGFFGTRTVKIMDPKTKDAVGAIYSHQSASDLASVDNVVVDPKLRNQGIGEVLYRELGAILQADGVKRLTGNVVAAEPLLIRKSVFGDFISLTDSFGDPITPGDAVNQLRAARRKPSEEPGAEQSRGDRAKQRALQSLDYVEPVSAIDPQAQFLPRKRKTMRQLQDELDAAQGESIYIDNIIRGLTKNPDTSVDWLARAKEALDREQEISTEIDRKAGAQEASYRDPAQFLPASSAGVDSPQAVRAAKKEWETKGTNSKYFKRWFGDSKVVDEEGNPQVVFHGTTHDFNTFDMSRTNDRNFFGPGHYFSSNANEARDNYANFFGPDLMARVEREIEKRLDALGEDATTEQRNQVRDEVQDELIGLTPHTKETYLKISNPIVLDRNRGTMLTLPFDDTRGTAHDFLDFIASAASDARLDGPGIVQDIAVGLMDTHGEDIPAGALYDAIRNHDKLWDALLDEGETHPGILFADAARAAGYDGIIDREAGFRFQHMLSVTPDTTHYIVFDGNQVKSATDNRGTFSPNIADIRFLPEKKKADEGLPVDPLAEMKSRKEQNIKLRVEQDVNSLIEQLENDEGRDATPEEIDSLRRLVEEEYTQGIRFLPAKKKAEEKLPLPPKAFIDPRGGFVRVGTATHDDYLIRNSESINKKFGLKIPPTQGKEDPRILALAGGFVRVSYEANNGRLTYEANAKKFGKAQRDRIFEHVADNLDSVDNLTVSLVDDKGKVVKSASRRFFEMDEDTQKLDSIPFVTDEGGAERGPRFLPSTDLLADEAFASEVDRIVKGETDGNTFNLDGTVFSSGGRPLDVVTVASRDLPVSAVDADSVREVLAEFDALLDNPNVKPGLFRIARKTPEGEAQVSVDVNAVVPQEFRDNTLDFARKNNQESFYDLQKNEVVPSGGDGRTVLNDPADIARAIEKLVDGKEVVFPGRGKKLAPVTVSEERPVLPDPESGAAFLPSRKRAEQTELGIDVPETERILNKAQRGQLNQRELREAFPEAVVPRSMEDKVPYAITESPLYKRTKGTEEQKAEAFADRLVKKYEAHADLPETRLGSEWYDKFTPLLKERYGKDAPVFAELLAATSPNNTPRINFQFAEAAFKRWKNGDFDGLIAKYEEGLTKLANGTLEKQYKANVPAKDRPQTISEATLMGWWIEKHDLVPRQLERMTKEGKVSPKFGMHSEAVLKVISRRWLDKNRGPKTLNFVQNLLGTSDEATVDMWAARTMREAGYSEAQPRWRILPENGMAVSDADFAFSQAAFRAAAKRLKMKPSALQGALWFIEKKLWADKGWSELNLGDYRTEIKRIQDAEAEAALPDPQAELF